VRDRNKDIFNLSVERKPEVGLALLLRVFNLADMEDVNLKVKHRGNGHQPYHILTDTQKSEIYDLFIHGSKIKELSRLYGLYFNLVKKTLIETGAYIFIDNQIKSGNKLCYSCKAWLSGDNFHKRGNTRDECISALCKKCRPIKDGYRPEYYKKWQTENKERKSEMDRQYRIKNIDKIKAYRKTPKHKILKKECDKRYALKNKDNETLNIAKRLRSRLSVFVKKGRLKNFSPLDYNGVELRQYLESKFKEGMSWDNYGRGGWNIDHIKPLVLFDLTKKEQVIAAFSLSNLQPLFENENGTKGSSHGGMRVNLYTTKP
jgi:hypothetical protein